jgi:hypothetical protein
MNIVLTFFNKNNSFILIKKPQDNGLYSSKTPLAFFDHSQISISALGFFEEEIAMIKICKLLESRKADIQIQSPKRKIAENLNLRQNLASNYSWKKSISKENNKFSQSSTIAMITAQEPFELGNLISFFHTKNQSFALRFFYHSSTYV